MRESIINFKTSDLLKLTGILFEPDHFDQKNKKTIAIFLHGNGTSDLFDHYDRILPIAKEFTEKGMSYLVFNNRGARYIQKFKTLDNNGVKSVLWGGKAYEQIKDCISDIDASVNYAKSLGYNEFSLIGASTGANNIVVYNYYKPDNDISKYVLSGGADDTGVYYGQLGEDNFNRFITESKDKVSKGLGLDIATDKFLDYISSYRSILDILNPDGDYNIFPFYESMNKRLGTKELFKELKSITKPTLIIYGENDEYCIPSARDCLSIIQKQLINRRNFNFEIIKDADHSLSNVGEEVANIEINFIK